jgi:PAS domain-containing protein
MSLTDFIHPDDVERTTAEIVKLVSGRLSAAFENRYRTRSGGYRLISWTSVSEGGLLHGVGRDMTEEYAARRERDRTWVLSPIIKAVATVQGDLISVNPAWIRALGWSEAESVGRNAGPGRGRQRHGATGCGYTLDRVLPEFFGEER